MSEEKNEKEDYSEFKDLVIARLDVMPPNFKLSIGNKGTFDKEELIYHVKRGDKMGQEIIEKQVNFIKALASGEVTKALTA